MFGRNWEAFLKKSRQHRHADVESKLVASRMFLKGFYVGEFTPSKSKMSPEK